MNKKISAVAMITLMACLLTACIAQKPQTEQAAQVTQLFASINPVGENATSGIDISSCDTFTQIVDKELEDGMGWTNTDFGAVNALVVSDMTYDNGDGNMAAIDATLFIYKDGTPVELGMVRSGGTAYPLAKGGSYLYAASNQWIYKSLVTESGIQVVEVATVEYDVNGDPTCEYASRDGESYGKANPEEAKAAFDKLFGEMAAAEVIHFDTVQR